ncbi:hypothetical protein [Ottowia testudinis]|uniref:Transmembrane protein n=1 Tax=Ottowia testudinis TaxID=2816950 RepID=A0A975H336_9BURK|nr:hypothetical protein [Ottowia testudinis]QTD44850.1 hypothetical protein J1M35_17625 [Ottowia testudinis]
MHATAQPRPRWRAWGGPALAIAYALWCLALLWWQPRTLLAIASFLLPCYLFICSWLWRRGWRPQAALLALLLPSLLAWAYPRYAARAELFYVAEYALVYATLCAWFASSLAGTPVITRVARRVHALTPAMQAYTVRLTRGWALYFALMAALSILVFALLGLPAWAFFTVVLSPISLATFLIGEHVMRYRWHPEFDRASLRHTIRVWREGGA